MTVPTNALREFALQRDYFRTSLGLAPKAQASLPSWWGPSLSEQLGCLEDFDPWIAKDAPSSDLDQIAPAKKPAPRDPWTWLTTLFPSYVTAPLAEHHTILWNWVWALERGVRPQPLCCFWPRGAAKALAVDTPIPTPSGWTTMGALRPGDEVFDHNGLPTVVLATSGVMVRDCYRITFSDGSSVVASDDHKWVVLHKYARQSLPDDVEDWARVSWPRRMRGPCVVEDCTGSAKSRGMCGAHAYRRSVGLSLLHPPVVPRTTRGSGRELSAQTLTTGELARAELRANRIGLQEHLFSIPLARPLMTASASLPIDPYVLGVWLGDGHSASARITVGAEDRDNLLELLQPLVDTVCRARPNGITEIGLVGIIDDLYDLQVINNKHVPDEYLRASIAQRLDLLRGLLDTDGTVDNHGRSASFTSIRQPLATACAELARSLGYKATVREERATLYGKDCGPVWRVRLGGVGPEVFGLRRKAEALRERSAKALRWSGRMHYIASIERVLSQPVQCITVDAPGGLFLAGEEMIPTHNSTSAELACVVVGARDARRYALYVSGRQDQADDHVSNIARMLESQTISEYYPALGERSLNKYGSSQGWRRNRVRTAMGLTVDAFGLDVASRGARLDEYRPDLIIFDDVDDSEDSQATVQKKIRIITQKLLPAGSPSLAVLFIQNIVHYESVAARLAGLTPYGVDFLTDRQVVGPIPALKGFQVERGDGPLAWRIVAGTPTWEGQNREVCQHQINSWGLKAFRSEAQHERTPPEGQAFPEFDASVHVVDNVVVEKDWPKFRAIDYGYASPFACLWGARRPDGSVVVYRELYQAGLTARQQAKAVAQLSEGEEYAGTVADPSMWSSNREGQKYQSTASVYRENGVEVTKASNERIIGWAAVHTMLAFSDEVPPNLVIDRSCENLIRTLPIMVKHPTKPDDLDGEQDDHTEDCLRYLLMAAVGTRLQQLLKSLNDDGKPRPGELPTIADPLYRGREVLVDPNKPPDDWPKVKIPKDNGFGVVVAGREVG